MNTGCIGIIMLDTRFPRPRGDIGNADSFSVPVLYRRVSGASATQAVRGDVDALLEPFIAAGKALVADGASIIGTSCGFLSLFQDELEKALDVSVVASSLTLASKLNVSVGILTIDAEALSERHLRAVGIVQPIPIVGLPQGGVLATAIFGDEPDFDIAKASAEVVAAAKELVANNPKLEAIVFECTNLGPYSQAVTDAVGLPAYSIVALVSGFSKFQNF